MPSKKHKAEEIIGNLREVEIVLAQGALIAEARRRIAVSEQPAFWRGLSLAQGVWRREHGSGAADEGSREGKPAFAP